MTTASHTFGTALIGQTEKALNAILDRQLAGTGVSEPQWVTLTLAVVGGGDLDLDDLVGRVGAATRFSRAAIHQRIGELSAAGLLRDGGDGRIQVTDEGRARWTQVRAAIGPITERLWGDLPAEDLAAAGRVLAVVLDRAHGELADA